MFFARFLSSYVMSVKCLGKGMNGSSESVMGSGSIAQCLLWVCLEDPCLLRVSFWTVWKFRVASAGNYFVMGSGLESVDNPFVPQFSGSCSVIARSNVQRRPS